MSTVKLLKQEYKKILVYTHTPKRFYTGIDRRKLKYTCYKAIYHQCLKLVMVNSVNINEKEEVEDLEINHIIKKEIYSQQLGIEQLPKFKHFYSISFTYTVFAF